LNHGETVFFHGLMIKIDGRYSTERWGDSRWSLTLPKKTSRKNSFNPKNRLWPIFNCPI